MARNTVPNSIPFPVVRDELIRIAERATTLDERLEGSFVSCLDEANPDLIQSRITNWKNAAANGDDRLFQKRLQMDGIDIETAHRVLGAVRFRNCDQLPQWVSTLQELIDSAAFVDAEKDGLHVPFEEVLLPFVQVAYKKLQKTSHAHFDLFTPAALESLEQMLLVKLSSICSRPLALELNVARLLGALKGDTAKDRYYYFVRHKIGTQDGLLAFFSEYPVAARLVAMQVDQWIDATGEFLERLSNDLPEIVMHFTNGEDPGKIVAIVDHLSDSHCHGRTTKQLSFASGLQVLYKPKNLTIDHAFQDLLHWINGKQRFLPLKTFSLLNKTSYGWVEFLSVKTCLDSHQIENYFHRAGMLLCILHVLGATDCHSENLFACGEHPVLVDLETLLEVCPAPDKGQDSNADEVAQEISRMSLQHTGMLPRWIFANAGADGADFSGLLGGKEQKLPYRIPRWVDTQTDRMRLEFNYLTVNTGPDRPMLTGSEEPIERGFEEMYRFLIESKDALRSSGLLNRLFAGEVRYLNRSTAEYALILQKSTDPNFLREGIDRSIHLDLLCRNVFLRDIESLWVLVKAERQALERLDIPYFTAGATETFLKSDRKEILPDLRLVSSRDRVLHRLSDLNVETMKRQILFMRACISMRGERSSANMADRTSEVMQVPVLNREDLKQAAALLGESLKSWAIHSPDGSATWIGAEYDSHSNQFSIAPVRDTFYSGKTGIALFLAALDRFVPNQGYAQLAMAAVQTLRNSFRGDKAQLRASSLQLGAMTGIGSISWSLLQIGKLLHRQDLIKDAATIGLFITHDLILKDRHLDFISGSAGAILSLLALHDSFPAAGFLDRAEECGTHLLEQSIQNGSQIRLWQTLRGERLTGFSHGAAGYAYAFFRLFQATGNEKYRDAAFQAFGYERSVFCREERNWPDLRAHNGGGADLRFMTGWCHGAPGIALSRIGCLSESDHPGIQEEIEIALDTTLRAGIRFQDDTCCGNFSRIETLLIASKHLKRPDLKKAALSQASTLVHLATVAGSFRVDPDIAKGLINPGFMKGIAGIGYALLRLADEENCLPSPLLM